MAHKAKKRARQEARDQVRETLTDMMRVFRTDLAKKIRALRRRPDVIGPPPLPCDTCAFRSSTDNDQGFETTAISLFTALATGRNFYCHRELVRSNDPDMPGSGWEPVSVEKAATMPPCIGWAYLHMEPALKLDQHFPEPFILGMVQFGLELQAKNGLVVEGAKPGDMDAVNEYLREPVDAETVLVPTKEKRSGPRSLE